MVWSLVPSLVAISGDILSVNLEPVKVNEFENTLLAFINGVENSFLEHLLANVGGFGTVFFDVFYNPLIY